MTENLEVWKSLKGLTKNGDNYEISNLGNVRNTTNKRVRKPQIDKDGYLLVSLYKDNKPSNAKIHRLIALAFIPNIENKPIINHKDGNKQNNEISNLEWSTSSENNQHAWDNDLKSRDVNTKGEKHGMSKLNESDVLRIRELYNTGNYSYSELGRIFDVTKTNVYRIIKRKSWKHI